MILPLNLYHCCCQRRKCHDLRCQITQFNVTRVIIVTFAGADGEMFVSRDYNYNHSVIRKRSVVVFDWPPCWNHFTALCCIFFQTVPASTQPHASTQYQPGTLSFILFSELCQQRAGDWPEPSELIFILACPKLEVMMPTAVQRLMGGQHRRREWALVFEVIHTEGNWYISLSPGPY